MMTDDASVGIRADPSCNSIKSPMPNSHPPVSLGAWRGKHLREITIFLYNEVNGPKMSSAQKLIERLEAKGCIERDRSQQRAHRFRALATQDEFLRSRLQALADRVCDGTLVPLATSLVRSKGLTRKEREELRKLVNEM